MNHWKRCLQCWIPVSKKNDEKSVINAGADAEDPGDLDRSSSRSVSFDSVPLPLPVPYRRSSAAAAVPYVEDSHFWTPPYTPYTAGNSSSDTSENYIPLDECLSGPRTSRQQRSLPKLVPRDIHLLDRVPPSPCSLTENPPGSLSGMPEVYAPMLSRNLVGPPSLSPRLASRGCDSPRRNPQGVVAKRDLHGQELGSFDGGSPNQKADHRNNNTFNFKIDHGRLPNGRTDPRSRLACSSVSSEASLTDSSRPCCPPRPLDPHSAVPDRSDCLLHYRNVPASIDRQCVGNQHSLPPSLNGTTSRTVDESTVEQLPSMGHSLDSKILHMTPPAPPQNSKAKAHRYVNANGGPHRAPEGNDSSRSTPSQSEDTAFPPTVAQSGSNESDGYYNLIPTNGQPAKTESGEQLTPPPPLPPPSHGHSSSRKKQFQQRPHLPHESPHHRRSPLSVAVALPQRARRKYSSKATDDSSSSNDEDGSSSGFSASNSNTSLNRPGDLSQLKCFTTKPPAPSQQPPIEYLQLDLDQPSFVSKGSPGPVHRGQNSTIDYIEIDPCRTKALSDTKRQLEINRHKTSH